MTRVMAFVAACVRCWTRMYTWGLPPAVRDVRRQEIDSDLWESSHDPGVTRAQLIIQMVTRVTLGMVDDLAWRFAQVTVSRQSTVRVMAAASVIGVLLLSVALLPPDVVHLPEPHVRRVHAQKTFPEPPPPPPPPGATATWREPTFQYGRSSYAIATQGPAPVLIRQVQPVYPPVAVAAGLEGVVLVRGTITEGGRVTDVEVEPAGVLGRSAVAAVLRWEFAPAENGTERAARLTVRVSFGRSQ